MVEVLEFLLRFKWIIIFYFLVALFFFLKRKTVARQGILLLYRTSWGLRWMDKIAAKYREWIILWGYVGVGAGFLGLLLISFMLIKNVVDVITTEAVSSVQPVLPGINIPGLGVLPFWDWILAIFLIAIIHEFSHGVVARAHNVQVKNTGIVLLGPILGAFVEPHEKKLRKERDIVQYSILAAGSWSNVLLAVAAFVLLSLIMNPLYGGMVEPQGVTFESYLDPQLPAAKAGLPLGTTITQLNGYAVPDAPAFVEELSRYHPGDKVKVSTAAGEYQVTLAEHPDNPKRGYLGIGQVQNKVEVKPSYQQGAGNIMYRFVLWFGGFLRWLFILSSGIGLFNLLPLPIVDGGRMAQVFLYRWKGSQHGERRYRQIGMFFLLLLLASLLLWFWEAVV